MPRLSEVIAALETLWPSERAESWDAVGLVCGDPADPVDRVLVCVDPDQSIVDEAIERGASMIVSHHPLMLRGVHGVPANTPKGGVVHRLIRAGIALFAAHTNADSADPGVSDALAAVLGLMVRGPLEPHPDGHTGIGRIGELPAAEPFETFVRRVAAALPATVWGVRGAGDPQRPIRTVAVCGGAGDSCLDSVLAAGVDAYVTADLRHHPASEHLARTGAPALVDVAHWAAEWSWLPVVRAEVDQAAAERGYTVDTRVSTIVTDPWTFRV